MLLAGGLLLGASSAQALEGRYFASYNRTAMENLHDSFLKQLLDARTTGIGPGDTDIRLDMSLVWGMRPGESGQSLLSSRFYGDVRNHWWRAFGQFIPWQDAMMGPASPRKRAIQVGGDVHPRGPFRVLLNYDRQDSDSQFGGSGWNQDWRANLSYRIRPLGTFFSYRGYESGGERSPVVSHTDDWRLGLVTQGSLRTLHGTAGYNANLTETRAGERNSQYYAQRFNLGGSWIPVQAFNLSATGFLRWGRTEDNAVSRDQTIDEKNLALGAAYRTRFGLEAKANRAYRESQTSAGPSISDYFQFQTIFRRYMLPRTLFQTGFSYTADLRNEANVPRNSVFASLDGELRRGLGARAEVRAAKSPSALGDGLQTRTLLMLRTVPLPYTRFDVQWWKDQYPKIAEVEQEDEQWEFQAAWQPAELLNLSGSYRRMDGWGRFERQDRYGTFTAGLKAGERTTLNFIWSRRVSYLNNVRLDNTTITTNLNFYLPREFRIQLAWSGLRGAGPEDLDTYTVSLEKLF